MNTYFDFLGSLYSTRYNASGRAYPDVSSIGEDVQVYVDKSVESIGGTSSLPFHTIPLLSFSSNILITARVHIQEHPARPRSSPPSSRS